MQNKNELVSEIFKQFKDIFKIDFEAYFSGDSNALSYDLNPFAQCREISEHLFYLGLKSLYEDKVKHISFPLVSLLSDSSSVSQALIKHRSLISNLQQLTSINEIKEQNELIQFTVSQLSNRELTSNEKLSIENSSWYSFAGFAKFTVSGLHSYCVGSVSGNALLPMKYAKSIYVIDDEKHVLDMARVANPGIYIISLTNDEEVAASCFYMLLKTTEGAIVLTDGDIKPYVGQRSRTDRKNLDRMSKSLFPYSVFDIEVLNGGRHTRFNNADSKSVVLRSESFKQGVIKDVIDISDISLGEKTNLAVLLTMIGSDWHKYIDSNQLITGSELLLASPEAHNGMSLPISFNGVAPISIPTVPSREDFYASTRECDEYAKATHNKEGTDRNSYFSEVFADEMNSVRIIADTHLLENKTQTETNDLVLVPQWGVATPQMLAADTIQLARERQAEKLKTAIDTYFDDNLGNMLSWVKNNTNVEKLALLAIEKKGFPQPKHAPDWMHKNGFGHSIVRCGIETNFRNRFEFNQDNDNLSKSYRIVLSDPIESKGKKYASCVVNGSYANFFVLYRVSDTYDLEYMTGVEPKDMPYHLQELGMDQYVGNSLLSRVDPVESTRHSYDINASNNFLFILGLSLSGLNKLRVNQGLEKLTKDEAKEMYATKYPNFW